MVELKYPIKLSNEKCGFGVYKKKMESYIVIAIILRFAKTEIKPINLGSRIKIYNSLTIGIHSFRPIRIVYIIFLNN